MVRAEGGSEEGGASKGGISKGGSSKGGSSKGGSSKGGISIGGYLENWKDLQNKEQLEPFDVSAHRARGVGMHCSDGLPPLLFLFQSQVLYYSFLTLSPKPNPDAPEDRQWDGSSIYETMTLADVMDVMAKVRRVPCVSYNHCSTGMVEL
jgi:hypothetical protein